MRLLVVRHGEAQPMRDQDATRCLTEAGQAQVNALALRLQSDWTHLRVLSSPYRRALQTAEILCSHLHGRHEVWPEITPEGSVRATVERLHDCHEDLIMVTHMYFLSELCGYLIEASPRSHDYPLATAGARWREADLWLPGSARMRGESL